jgi:hypothetical protein
MNQSFNRKLLRSLFIITAAVALSLALSHRSGKGCTTGDCSKCAETTTCRKVPTNNE